MGWFVSYHVFASYARWVNVYEGALDERQMTEWVRQAASLPGWRGF